MPCKFCEGNHADHVCPRISAVEYYPDGNLRRVEYHKPGEPFVAFGPQVVTTAVNPFPTLSIPMPPVTTGRHQ